MHCRENTNNKTMMWNRRDRYLRCLQNVPASIAILALVAIDNERIYLSNEEIFSAWDLKHVVEFLRPSNHIIHKKKRKRDSENDRAQDVNKLLRTLRTPGYMTSQDYLICGSRENFNCHSKTGPQNIMKALHLNPFNFQAYIACMEAFNYYVNKPSLSICRHFLLALHYSTLMEKMIRYDLTIYEDKDVLNRELLNVLGFKNEFKSFIIMMRSEYPNTGIFDFNLIKPDIIQALEYSHPNVTLFASFVLSFCASNTLDNVNTIIALEQKCIDSCGPALTYTVKPYAYCAIALTNIHIRNTTKALECVEEAIKLIPGMYRALDLRSQINILNKNYESALRDIDQMIFLKPEKRSQISKAYANRAVLCQLMGDTREAELSVERSLFYDINNVMSQTILLQDALSSNNPQLFVRLVENNVSLMTHAMSIVRILRTVVDIFEKFGMQTESERYQKIFENHVKSMNRIS
jgi:tetratricopeptide (TPR) repeat protein